MSDSEADGLVFGRGTGRGTAGVPARVSNEGLEIAVAAGGGALCDGAACALRVSSAEAGAVAEGAADGTAAFGSGAAAVTVPVSVEVRTLVQRTSASTARKAIAAIGMTMLRFGLCAWDGRFD